MKQLFTMFSFLSITISFNAALFAQQISFAPVDNLEVLITNVFGIQCEGVTNVQMIGSPLQIGRFENGGALGLSSGLVMSTGLVENSGQPSSTFSSNSLGTPGDTDIEAFGAAAGQFETNYDACAVIFNFQPLANGDISFTYIFASEEYPEFSGSAFTDRFLFLVSENGGPYQNIAFIPGTTTPVEINTVNQFTNNQYYVDNELGPNAATFVFDGYTVPLTASFTAQLGSSYTIKLVIADVSDGVFDSAIFLDEQGTYNDISGALTIDGQPAQGVIDIFNFVQDDVSLATPVYSIDVSNGSFLADSLETGLYHARFTPDPVLFPNAAPLYFVGGETWEEAQIIGLPCFIQEADINASSLDFLSGNGSISGTVYLDTSYTRILLEPYAGALVKLMDNNDELVAFAYSNELGEFTFTSLPEGTYHILLDVPYIPQIDEHDIVILGDGEYVGANFEILPDGIFAIGGVYLNTEELTYQDAVVYPNPASNELHILNASLAPISFELIGINGQKLFSGSAHSGISAFDLSAFESGVYFLHLSNQQVVKILIAR